MKRILDCTASDFQAMTRTDLKQSIEAAEGRTIIAEVVVTAPPLYPGLTNAEYAAAFGADMILLNFFDVFNPRVEGVVNVAGENLIKRLKELLGRPVGINLEPVDTHARAAESLEALPVGRLATRESLAKAKELGVDFVCLTGNPKTGVTNEEIVTAINNARDVFRDEGLIIAGKMHGAGVKGEASGNIVSKEIVESFVHAGADIILVPGVGTVPGTTLNKTTELIETAQSLGALALTTIGTSQEGAEKETIQQIALYNKMAGADLHHIGDAGFTGIAVPENIMSYSIAIRGRRHTYRRMAASILR